jgi:hypothetical protein
MTLANMRENGVRKPGPLTGVWLRQSNAAEFSADRAQGAAQSPLQTNGRRSP